MAGLIEAASAIMRAAERRMDVAAGNVANASTPGYKAMRLAGTTGSDFDVARARASARMDQGKLVSTSRPLDLAIEGSGFFAVRDGDQLHYTRAGSFRIAADGSVQTRQGQVLQQVGGGDLVLDKGDTPTIESDGTVLQDSRSIGRVAVFTPAEGTQAEALGGGLFALTADAAQADNASIRQGATEASNVSIGDEMISIMAATRGAESGAKLVQIYDDLLGKATAAFGGADR